MNVVKPVTFWNWLIKGSGSKPGYRKIVDLWLIIHMAIGVTLALIVPIDLKDAANTVLLPLAGILIGLSFAWGGNVQALLQTSEIEQMADYHAGGFEEYLHTYQLAIFIILLTLVGWALAGFNIFDNVWPTKDELYCYFVVSFILYSISSLALRECWHIVLGAQYMLMLQNKIKRVKKGKDE